MKTMKQIRARLEELKTEDEFIMIIPIPQPQEQVQKSIASDKEDTYAKRPV